MKSIEGDAEKGKKGKKGKGKIFRKSGKNELDFDQKRSLTKENLSNPVPTTESSQIVTKSGAVSLS